MSKNRDDYYDKASTWDQEIIANALLSKKRAWIFAFISQLTYSYSDFTAQNI